MDINEQLVRLFHDHENEFLSGQNLATQLNVTRTTIWNHINYLKELGYQFESHTNAGYKLVGIPDLMLPDELSFNLNTKIIGSTILSYTEVDSTNDIAIQRAEANIDCFATNRIDHCGEFACLWRADCLSEQRKKQ